MKQKNTLSETYTLMNGINIPKIGLGTWFIPDDEAAATGCSISNSTAQRNSFHAGLQKMVL